MTEANISDMILLKYPFMYRNNRGAAFIEKTCTSKKTGKIIKHKSFVRFGIPEPQKNEKDEHMKGGDRIGFIEVEITPDMVGKTVAVFANIEIKAHGDTRIEGQVNFHNFVLEHGGISQFWEEKTTGEITVTEGEI